MASKKIRVSDEFCKVIDDIKGDFDIRLNVKLTDVQATDVIADRVKGKKIKKKDRSIWDLGY